ncbi:MAG: hypothetical protein PHR25_05645 [Clostridia bacterium]|nr:hypothetical protein [Clostridia bacterium]MDD4376248.1 hypothetical protein [Clostridia bacterium]
MRKSKRKSRKLKIILLLTLIILVIIPSWNFFNSKFGEIYVQEENQTKVNEERLKEKIYETKLENTKRVVKELNEETEIILLEEKGEMILTHNKRQNKDNLDWLIGSSITIKVVYNSIFSIKTDLLSFQLDSNGILNVEYELRDIKLKSIENYEITPVDLKGLFGKAYMPSEVAALVLISNDRIRTELENDYNIKKRSEASLNDYLNELFAIYDIRLKITCKE